VELVYNNEAVVKSSHLASEPQDLARQGFKRHVHVHVHLHVDGQIGFSLEARGKGRGANPDSNQ